MQVRGFLLLYNCNSNLNPLKYIVLFGALLLALPSIAVPTVIEGKVDDYYKEHRIELIRFSDRISFRNEFLQNQFITEEGTFKFELDLEETILVVLRSNHVNAMLYLHPGTTYKVSMPKLRADQAITIANTNVVELDFEQLPANDINSLISDLNLCYEQFVEDNYQELAKQSFQKELDAFKADLIEHSFQGEVDPYFVNYRKYMLASLDQMRYQMSGFADSRKLIFEQYFKDQPIRYENVEYMNFFHAFHDQYLQVYIANYGSNVISYAINGDEANYSFLLQAFGKDAFLENMQLREMVVLKSMTEIFHTGKYQKQNVLALIDSVALTSKHEENRKIAHNIKHELTRLTPGYAAPNFKLTDIEGNEFSLKDFEGQYIYIGFWATWAKSGIVDMSLMPEMLENYGKHVAFISICADDDPEAMKTFLEQHPEYEWTFLYGGDNAQLLQAYNVRSLPSYFLIGPDGKLMQAPALSPTPNGTNLSIDETLHHIKAAIEGTSTSGVGERRNR